MQFYRHQSRSMTLIYSSLIFWSLFSHGSMFPDGILLACHDEESNCKCQNKVLDCSKKYIVDGPLTVPTVLEYYDFVNATFEGNDIAELRKGFILSFSNRTAIQKFLFADNKISKIEPKAFDVFTSLKELDLRGNPLTTIDSDVLTPKLGSTLRALTLSDTTLESLPLTAFQYMTNLNELNLKGVTKVTRNFTKELFGESLQNLHFLNLAGNNISEFNDDVFVNLKNLHSLVLITNPLTSIPKALHALQNLIGLHMDSNNIRTLDNTSFIGINPGLKDLELGRGNLTIIGECAFCPLKSLNFLGLSSNPHLTAIPENAFHSEVRNRGIKYLQISYTGITTLSENLLNWDGVDHLQIGGNPYVCNCSLAWLIDDLKSQNSRFLKKLQWNWLASKMPRCANPYYLATASFSEVSEKFCKLNRTRKGHDVMVSENGKYGDLVVILVILVVVMVILGCIFRRELINFYLDFRYKTLRADDSNIRWSYDPENDDVYS